jgi:hypothetical protein
MFFRIDSLLIILSVINSINTQECGPKASTSILDCLDHDSQNNYCCFTRLKFINQKTIPIAGSEGETTIQSETISKNLCVLIPQNVTFAVPYFRSMELPGAGNIDVDIDCGDHGINNTTSQHICGSENPTSIGDCNAHSTETQNCCYLKSNSTSVCLYGLNTDPRYDEIFGYTLQCSGSYVFTSLILLLIYLTFMF